MAESIQSKPATPAPVSPPVVTAIRDVARKPFAPSVKSLRAEYDKLAAQCTAAAAAKDTPEVSRLMKAKQEAFAAWYLAFAPERKAAKGKS